VQHGDQARPSYGEAADHRRPFLPGDRLHRAHEAESARPVPASL